jgi:hypothetical protein
MQYREAKNTRSYPSLSRVRKQNSKIFCVLPFCFLLFGGGLVGCSKSAPLGMHGLTISQFGVNVTKINELPQNPNATATVYIQGQVADHAPFLAAGAYEVQDATGTIWVLTNKTVPSVGDQVLIKGQVQFQSIPLAGKEFGEVYVQEQEQLKRKPGQPQQLLRPEGS